MKSKKVIIDTNLLISFLISKNFNQIDLLLEQKEIVLVFSIESLEEFIQVAGRPKISQLIDEDDLRVLISQFEIFGKLIAVKSDLKICRDSKDDFLLNLAVDSQADFLVTGDADLLVLENIRNTKICNWNTFLREIL